MTLLAPLIRPRTLSPGDRVRVIAPSGPVPPDLLQEALRLVEGWGLLVETSAPDPHTTAYLAATDADRAAQLAEAWSDPGVRAILCARGGYGVQRMVDLVDWDALRAARAPEDAPALVGYSDITGLHEAVAAELGVSTLLGPMLATDVFLASAPSREALRAALMDSAPAPALGAGARTLVPGTAKGPVVGGNASLLASGLGTPHTTTSYAGGLVLLEEVDEEDYRLDRILTQLRRSGLLDGAAAILGGNWVDCVDDGVADALLLDRFGDLGIPIVNGLPTGHASPQAAVWLRQERTLTADRDGVALA